LVQKTPINFDVTSLHKSQAVSFKFHICGSSFIISERHCCQAKCLTSVNFLTYGCMSIILLLRGINFHDYISDVCCVNKNVCG